MSHARAQSDHGPPTVGASIFLILAVLAAGSTTIGFAVAGAGSLGNGSGHFGFDPNANMFTVEKVVAGPVPTITDPFVVEVTCVSSGQDPDIGPIAIQFGADGVPADNSTFAVGPNYTCTAVETVANGAAVSYACTATPPAQCSDDQTAVFGDFDGADATFTVTNTYEPTASAPPPADVVAAQPAFTG